jgi:Cft2 family RNA processing exonuclease
MNTKQNKWIEKYPNYWVHQKSNWIVRDYLTDDDVNGWVILDNNEKMISCEWKETKEDCMDEVEFILTQEKRFGQFRLTA